MNRSGYGDDCDGWSIIRWRGAVASAIRGRRGQAFLKEMLAALDALPEPKLIAHDLEDENGLVCAIGSVGKARGLSMDTLNPYDRDAVAGAFGIATALAAEIEFMNDEWWSIATPEGRFTRMRAWIEEQIKS